MARVSISKLLDMLLTNPDALEGNEESLDALLMDVVRIEKKHLYGLEQTTAQRRRTEILDLLTKKLK